MTLAHVVVVKSTKNVAANAPQWIESSINNQLNKNEKVA
jgi:hypothetical protein